MYDIKFICLLIINIIMMINSFKLKCNENCNNFYNLTINSEELIIKKIKINITTFTFPKTIKAYILERKRFRAVVFEGFGDRPITYETLTENPNKAEAIKWINKNKCYIGTICKPNGECWGNDADICYETTLEIETENRHFQFEKLYWSKSLYRTCTQDFECSIREKKFGLNALNSTHFYIDLEDKKMIMNKDEEFFSKEASFSIFFKPIHNVLGMKNIANCIEHKDVKYCDTEIENNKIYFLINKFKKTTINNVYIEYDDTDKNNEETKNKIITIKDIKILENEVRTIETNQNFNNYMLSKNLEKTINIVNEMIKTIIKIDPFLMKRILNMNVISRSLGPNKFLEICPCTEEFKNQDTKREFCNQFNKAHKARIICDETNITKNINQLELINWEKSKYTFVDSINYQGKDRTIFEEDLMEQKNPSKQSFDESKGGKRTSHYYDIFSLFGDNIIKMLCIINTCLIILILLFKK